MPNPARTWLKLFATASAVAGFVFGLLAIGFALYTFNFIRHASRTDGTVVALTEHIEDDKSVTYTPTFTFTTGSSRSITKKSHIGTNPGFSLGERVPILYDPKNPQDAKIATTAQLWLVPIILGIICVLFMPVGLFLLRRSQLRQHRFRDQQTNA